MIISDGKRTVSIVMRVWDGSGYGPDFSIDFFDAGLLPFDSEADTYTVQDVEYCIEQAQDYIAGVGDFSDSPAPDDTVLFVEDIE